MQAFAWPPIARGRQEAQESDCQIVARIGRAEPVAFSFVWFALAPAPSVEALEAATRLWGVSVHLRDWVTVALGKPGERGRNPTAGGGSRNARLARGIRPMGTPAEGAVDEAAKAA